MSASTFVGGSALAGVPAEIGSLQVADNQQPPPPQGQKSNGSQGQQHNNQPQGQQYHEQPKTYVQPKLYGQPQGQQYQQQQKTNTQPQTYGQPQGQQYQQQPKIYTQPTYGQPQGQQYQQQQKTYTQPQTYGQPQGQQYSGQQNQQGHRYDWSTYRPGHQPPKWQEYHQNFDPHPYQWNREAERRYQWEVYREPRGWYYRRWSYGEVFPVIFWTQDYWINSYWEFGLPDPPYGYIWVRYGPDALLIDVESGQILSVVYGLFY